MEEDGKEDIPGSIVFPEDLLREVRVPKHKSGGYTDEEKRAIFLKHCRAEGLRLAEEVTNIADAEETVINKGTDILVGRRDRIAVETLFANFAHGFALTVVNDRDGRPRTAQATKEEMPEVESKRTHTYKTLWQGIAKRG